MKLPAPGMPGAGELAVREIPRERGQPNPASDAADCGTRARRAG